MSDNLQSTKLVEEITMKLYVSIPTCPFEEIGPQTTINDDSNYDDIQNSTCSKSMAVNAEIICSDNQKSECDIISFKNKNIKCREESLDHNDTIMRVSLSSDANSLEMNDILSDDNDSDWEDIDDNDGDNNDNVLLSDDKSLENIHYNYDPNILINDNDLEDIDDNHEEDIDDNHDSVFLDDGNSLKKNNDHNYAAILSDDNDSDWEDIDDSDCANNDTVLLNKDSSLENTDSSSNNIQNDRPISPTPLILSPEQLQVYTYMNSNPTVKSFMFESSTYDDNIIMYDIDEIVEVVDARQISDLAFYLVKWKNWSVGFNTWERYPALHNSQKRIFDFFKKKLRRDEPINIMHLMLSRQIITQLFETFRTLTGLSLPLTSLDFIPELFNTLGRSSPNSNAEINRKKFIKSYLSTISLEFFRQIQFQELRQWEIDICVISSSLNIKVENNMDLEGPPNSFVYLSFCITKSEMIISGNPLSGCLCKKSSTDSCNKFSGQALAYDVHKKLKVFSNCPIFECNKECKCMSSCINRVVQHGSKVDVCIYKSRFPGWALKTYQNIEKGQFVGLYVGEIISFQEYNQRLQDSSSSIDYTWELYLNDTNKFKYFVDSTNYGNFTRFINHSCEANLSMHTVWIDCLDGYFPQLALFANRNIFSGEQLTTDYFIKRSEDSLKKSGIKCQCEMKNCKGYYF